MSRPRKRAGRTAFGEMVAFLRDTPWPRPLPLVEKTDRLYRNIKDWVTIDDLGVEVYLVKEGVILAKNAHNLFIRQDPNEQARLLKILLSICAFDRGSLCPTYSKPFDLSVFGNESGDWRAQQDSNLRPPGS